MKIIVLHGDNLTESYSRLTKFMQISRKRGWEIVRPNNANIMETVASDSLFSTPKLILIENIKALNKKTLLWLKNREKMDVTVVIYHQGTLAKTFLNSLPNDPKIEEYKIPKLIWSFLDSFYPGNAKNLMLLLHKLRSDQPIEFIFSLLAKLVRDLYWLKKDPKGLSYPSWRITKLQSQAKRFSEDKLKDVIGKLADIDIKAKSSDNDLADLLELFIAEELE